MRKNKFSNNELNALRLVNKVIKDTNHVIGDRDAYDCANRAVDRLDEHSTIKRFLQNKLKVAARILTDGDESGVDEAYKENTATEPMRKFDTLTDADSLVFDSNNISSAPKYRRLLDQINCKKPKNIVRFSYMKYISENDDFKEDFTSFLHSTSEHVALMKAPCGSGKTFFVNSIVPQSCPDLRVIMAAPTNNLATQCGQCKTEIDGRKYRTSVVASGSSNLLDFGFYDSMQLFKGSGWEDLNFSGVYRSNADKNITYMTEEGAISVVWDCFKYADKNWYQLRKEDYQRMVLFVDEAHLLIRQENFRQEAIHDLQVFINKVIAAGGHVVFMTSTSDVIFHYGVDRFYDLRKVDKDGFLLPTTNTKKIRILTFQKYSIIDAAFDLCVQLHMEGKRPLVEYNDLKEVYSLQDRFKAYGLKVCVITSMDKEKYSSAKNQNQKGDYINPDYKNLVEKNMLPDADVYLVTSVIEVGTSIVKTSNEIIVPVYVCKRENYFDMDAIEQFQARTRFPVEESIVLHKQPSHPPNYPMKTLESILMHEYDHVMINAKGALATENVRDEEVDGREVFDCLDETVSNYDDCRSFNIDFLKLFDEVFRKYNAQAYYNDANAYVIFRERFHVPVETDILEQKKLENSSRKAGHCINEKNQNRLMQLSKDQSFVDAVCNNNFDKPEVKEAAEIIGGSDNIIRLKRNIFKAPSGTDAMAVTLIQITDPDNNQIRETVNSWKNADYEKVRHIPEICITAVYEYVISVNSKGHNYRKLQKTSKVLSDTVTTEEYDSIVKIARDRLFKACFNVYRELRDIACFKWENIIGLYQLGQNKVETIAATIRVIKKNLNTHLNIQTLIDIDANKAIADYSTIEYLLLRYFPYCEKHFLGDQCSTNLRFSDDEEEFAVDEVLDNVALDYICRSLEKLVYRFTKTGKYYRRTQIKQMLEKIFTWEYAGAKKKGAPIRITGLRTDFSAEINEAKLSRRAIIKKVANTFYDIAKFKNQDITGQTKYLDDDGKYHELSQGAVKRVLSKYHPFISFAALDNELTVMLNQHISVEECKKVSPDIDWEVFFDDSLSDFDWYKKRIKSLQKHSETPCTEVIDYCNRAEENEINCDYYIGDWDEKGNMVSLYACMPGPL